MAPWPIHFAAKLTFSACLLALGFEVIEFCWPNRPTQRRFRKGWATDAWYLLFTPLITQNLGRVILAVVLLALCWLAGIPLNSQVWLRGWGPVSRLSYFAQASLVLVVGDFVGYWTHRLFHRDLWPIHAIHHSSEEMDWLSTVRLHPLNDFLGSLMRGLPFVLTGFAPVLLASFLPLLAIHAFLLHANVKWSFGPFRYVITSPVFHRWHHSAHAEARDKNFAGLFPLWDILFGTFYMPAASRPQYVGVPEAGVPEAFLGQVLYPLRARSGRARGHLYHPAANLPAATNSDRTGGPDTDLRVERRQYQVFSRIDPPSERCKLQ